MFYALRKRGIPFWGDLVLVWISEVSKLAKLEVVSVGIAPDISIFLRSCT